MISRLWHLLYRHQWRERGVVWNAPKEMDAGEAAIYTFGFNYEEKHRTIHGFTDVTYTCHCGALKTHRLVGKHVATNDSEVEALRKLVGL